MQNETYQTGLTVGLSKIAQQADPVSLKRSFFAGFDPTGTATFDLSQRARRHGAHLASGFAGGIVGGATILPSAVTGAMGAVSGFSKMKGGVGARLLGGLAGFARGAVMPYKQLYHGTKALKVLKGKGPITEAAAKSIHKALGLKGGEKAITSAPVRQLIRFGRHTVPGKGVTSLLAKQTGGAYAGIGAGAALGAGSSVLQYMQGKKIGDERRQYWSDRRA